MSFLESLSTLDTLVLTIILLAILHGGLMGIAKVGVSCVATLMGLSFGFWHYDLAAPYLARFLGTTGANIAGFFLIFVAFLILGAVVGFFLSSTFKLTGFSWLDRLLGAWFGLVQGCIVSVILLAVLMSFATKPPPLWLADSRFLPYALDAADLCERAAPTGLKITFDTTVAELKQMWENEKVRRRDQ